jgi:hypothetical protein
MVLISRAPESAAEVVADFQRFMNDGLAALGFATVGLRYLEDRTRTAPVLPENPDPMVYVGGGDPNRPENWPRPGWQRSELLERIAVEGPVETLLTQQWIVFTYAAWEHEFRPRLAAALGREAGEIQVPWLGDFRRWRHDILHHHGVATPERTGKCEVLKWFAPGDEIKLRNDHISDIARTLPGETLTAEPPVAPS